MVSLALAPCVINHLTIPSYPVLEATAKALLSWSCDIRRCVCLFLAGSTIDEDDDDVAALFSPTTTADDDDEASPPTCTAVIAAATDDDDEAEAAVVVVCSPPPPPAAPMLDDVDDDDDASFISPILIFWAPVVDSAMTQISLRITIDD